MTHTPDTISPYIDHGDTFVIFSEYPRSDQHTIGEEQDCMAHAILVIEDDRDIAHLVALHLQDLAGRSTWCTMAMLA